MRPALTINFYGSFNDVYLINKNKISKNDPKYKNNHAI